MPLSLTPKQAAIWESIKTAGISRHPISRFTQDPRQIKKDSEIRKMLIAGKKPEEIRSKLHTSNARIYRIRREIAGGM